MSDPIIPPEPEQAPDIDPDWNFDSSKNLILVTDAFGMFLRVSESVHAILGYDRDAIEGRLAIDFIHPSDLAGTRENMRLIRRTGRARHFYCRYQSKSNRPVELIWTGIWEEDKERFVFVGRQPRRSERVPLLHRLDALDGFQISMGLFALSICIAIEAGIGSNSTSEVRDIIRQFGGHVEYWLAALLVYGLACLSCLEWRNKGLQVGVTIFSVFLWLWMGSVTVLAPTYAAAVGIYELMLGLSSIVILFFRGRQI